MALRSIDLLIEQGEFFSLLGPSGCGKSTLLRILAGLESATGGEIFWNGQRIDVLPARKRPFNMVFQKYALFPHLTIFENIAFSLRLQKWGAADIRRRVTEVLDLVNLRGFEERLPETLSGGQAQRVALARALVNRPQVLLLDEPLAALDQKLREHMQTELRLLQKQLGLTFIFVTHDQEEAMLLSDRIAVMNGGQIEQVSAPRQLYENPCSAFCAQFVGRRNEFDGRAVSLDDQWISLEIADGKRIRGRAMGQNADPAISSRQKVQAFVRPELLKILPRAQAATPGYNVIEGQVLQVLFRGLKTEVLVGLNENGIVRSFIEDGYPGQELKAGERVGLEFSPNETHLFLVSES